MLHVGFDIDGRYKEKGFGRHTNQFTRNRAVSLRIVPDNLTLGKLINPLNTIPFTFLGGLTASQFPVFTLYIQKVCMPSAPVCDRAWAFEKVDGFAMDKYAKKRGRVSSRQNCEMLCMAEKEFPCR